MPTEDSLSPWVAWPACDFQASTLRRTAEYRLHAGAPTIRSAHNDAQRGLVTTPCLAGAGPRHLAFSPAASFAYVLNELDNTVTPLRLDAGSGTFGAVEGEGHVSLLPRGTPHADGGGVHAPAAPPTLCLRPLSFVAPAAARSSQQRERCAVPLPRAGCRCIGDRHLSRRPLRLRHCARLRSRRVQRGGHAGPGRRERRVLARRDGATASLALLPAWAPSSARVCLASSRAPPSVRQVPSGGNMPWGCALAGPNDEYLLVQARPATVAD